MHKEWRDLRTPHERLQWARQYAGYADPTAAAEALGMSGSAASTYYGHENSTRGLSRAGHRYAEFFRVSYEWLMRGKGAPTPTLARNALRNTQSEPVRIIGRAGAGPEGSVQFAAEGGDIGTAPRQANSTVDTVALEVWGNSMRPLALDGWLIYYDQRRAGISPDMIGQPCVIGLASGHTLVKMPYPGSKRGLFHLESANPAFETMRDQRVEWAALVTAIIPRRAARKALKDVRGEASV